MARIEVEPQTHVQKNKPLMSDTFFELIVQRYNREPTAFSSVWEVKADFLKQLPGAAQVPLIGALPRSDNSLPYGLIDCDISRLARLVNEESAVRGYHIIQSEYLIGLQKMIRNKEYGLIFLSKTGDELIADISDTYRKRFDSIVHSPIVTTPNIDNALILRNSEGLMNAVKYSIAGSVYGAGTTLTITDFFYLAILNTVNQDYKVACTMVVKTKDVPFIRACFLTNRSIPISMLELWVDSDIFGGSSAVFYTYNRLPPFATTKENKEWSNTLTEKLLEHMRAEKGITAVRNTEALLASTGNRLITSFSEAFMNKREEILSTSTP